MTKEGHKKRPDTDGRDQRGRFQCGRRKGRPPGAKNLVSGVIDDLINANVEAIAQTIINKALAGNITAATAVFRTKVAPARERSEPIIFKLPPLKSPRDSIAALAEIAAGATDGRINVEAATGLVALIREFRQAFMVESQEARILALEVATKTKTGQGR